MNTIATSPSSAIEPLVVPASTHRRSFSWPAVFAGVVAAVALQALFMLLGAGLGFSVYSPLTEENPIAVLGIGAVFIQGLSAVLSLWFGGWIAGRCAPIDADRSNGWLHGFSVWSASTFAAMLIVTLGAGWIIGDISKIVGGGLSLAGQPAAEMASKAMSPDGGETRSSGMIGSFVDEATSAISEGGAAGISIRAKREIGLASARLFNPTQDADTPQNRAALTSALTQNTGINSAAANQMVADWSASYKALKADLATAKEAAEAKARQVADEASRALTIYSLCAFLAFALGAVAAIWGGREGASHAMRREPDSSLTAQV